MEIPPLPEMIEGISEDDWRRTPASVQQGMLRLSQEVAELKRQVAALVEQNQQLAEQLASNSRNSSRPPSSDGPQAVGRLRKPATGRARGGQPGHEAHQRKLIPTEQCQKVVNHYPERCLQCGHELEGEDRQPVRHQVVELPPVEPYVEEHRLHQLACPVCGTATRASLPAEVSATGYGPGVVARVAVLSGVYRASERLTQAALDDLFGVQMSLGTVNKLRQEASQAVAEAVEEAHAYVQHQPVVHADETGFAQANADGANPQQRKAWLWVAVTALVTVFQVSLSRGQVSARALLGAAFAGMLISDRGSGYGWVDVLRRQLCWAHLKREFQKLAERGGISGRLGEALLEQERQLFAVWYRVRDGTLTRADFQVKAQAIGHRVKVLLEEGASYKPTKGDQSARAKTARTCRELLKVEPALWRFVWREGVEPTNNAAERAIRPAVLWRRTSFGTQSAAGSEFVARMLTVVMTLRAQQRNVLHYMTQACRAAREGKPVPSLLPKMCQTECHLLSAA